MRKDCKFQEFLTQSYEVVLHLTREVSLTDHLQGLAEGDGSLHQDGDAGQEGVETVGVGTVRGHVGVGELPQHYELS